MCRWKWAARCCCQAVTSAGVNEMDVAAYQNMRGQIPMVCKAGAILVLHHGIWHCGRQNKTDRRRYMFKLRLNPVRPAVAPLEH